MTTLYFLGIFATCLIIGMPIAFALGMSSLVYLLVFVPNVALSTIPQQMYAGADSFALTAIPFFVLVGELMTRGGISRRLVVFARTMVGHLVGGMGIVSLIASMIFASFSGSSVANAAGVGGITIPTMIRSRYPRGLASAVECSASSLGAVIPPSIPMIVYGSIAGVSIGGLFVGGYVPGLLFGLGLALVLRRSARKYKIPLDARATRADVWRAAKEAGPALLTPLIIMGGIMGGIMTPTESGAVAALYAFLVSYFIHKEVTLADLPSLLLNTAVTTGIVMLVMTAAAVFSWIMAYQSVPTDIADLFLEHVKQPWLFMLILVAFLLVVGCFIDTISALIILTPVLVPVAKVMNIDPLYLGVIVCIALTFGVLTPPVGVCLYVTSTIAKTTVEETTRFLIPFLVVLFALLFAITLVPSAIVWLPRAVGF